MAIANLTDLYVHELQDLYSANEQCVSIHERMHGEAKSDDLKAALKDAIDGIKSGMGDVKSVCEGHGKKVDGTTCKGMKGLVEEAKAHVFDETFGDDDTKDAAIIAQAQRMNHYALAGYGTATAFAKSLKLTSDHDTLYKNLDNLYSGDRRLTKIAETSVNAAAKSG